MLCMRRLITWYVIALISLSFPVSADTSAGSPQETTSSGNSIVDRWDRFPSVVVPRTVTPKLDGVIHEEEWSGASRIIGLVSYADGLLTPDPTVFWLCHDGHSLYVAARLDRTSGADPKITVTGVTESLWNTDDGIEFCFSPDKDRKMVLSLYGNASGGYSKGIGFGDSFDSSLAFKVPVEYRSRFTGNAIEVEMQLPLDSLNEVARELGVELQPLLDGQSWGFNPMRVDILPSKVQSDWSHLWGSFYSGNRLGRLRFAGDRKAVRVDSIGDLGDDSVGVQGTVFNGGSDTEKYMLEYDLRVAPQDNVAVRFSLYDAWDMVYRFRAEGPMVSGLLPEQQIGESGWLDRIGKAFQYAKTGTVELSVPGGTSKPFTLKLDKPSGQFFFAYRIKDASGNVLISETKPIEVKKGIQLKLDKRFLTKGGVYLTADVSKAEVAKSGDSLELALTGATGDVLNRWELNIKDAGKPLQQFIDMKSFPVGDYVLEAAVHGTNRDRSAARVDFRKPETPSWWKNDLGYTDKVPRPFTPVQASETQASVWGRTVGFSRQSPLPVSITSQGIELLSAPLSLDAVCGGRPVDWKSGSFTLKSSTPRRAEYEGIYTSAGLHATINTTIEYDGLIIFRIALRGSGTLDRLALQIPLRREVADHFGTSFTGTELATARVSYKAGKLADFVKLYPEGNMPFNGLFFIGNGDVGLEWICEEDRYWSNADQSKQMHLAESPDAVTLLVNFVDRPIDLSIQRTLMWALMPAPVKDISWYHKFDLNTSNGITSSGPEGLDEKALVECINGYKAVGITHFLTGGWGAPFHADVWVRGHNRIDFGKTCEIAHKNGMKVLYYGCWGYDVNGEEAPDFRDEMVKRPLEPCFPDTYWYDPEGPFVDFFMAGLKWNMDTNGIDGIYLDGMPTTGLLFDPVMDQGYVDDQGKPHGKWPIFALRSWAERMYTMMHETERKDGIVYLHDSGIIPNLAVESFGDFRCSGEEAPSREGLLPSWPIDEYFVKANERQYGIPMHTLWYNWWNRPLKENQVLAETLLFGQLINRTTGCIAPNAVNAADYEKDSTPHAALLKLFKSFDVGNATWIPYWRSSKHVSLQPSTLKASMFLHPGHRALLVVSNLESQPVKDGQVILDLDSMGFGGSVSVRDAFLSTTLPTDGSVIRIDVYDERYRLLLIEPSK